MGFPASVTNRELPGHLRTMLLKNSGQLLVVHHSPQCGVLRLPYTPEALMSLLQSRTTFLISH